MNNILTQNDGNNQLGIGSSQINLVGVANDSFDITQGTTSFMSFSTVDGSRKISVKKPITLNNNLLTIKSTAKIDSAPTNSLFYIDDNSELKTLGIGTTDEYLRMGFNRPAWGPKTFTETNISGIGSIGYLEELKIDDDKLIGIGSVLGVTDSSSSNIIKYDTNNDTSLIMSNGVGIGTLTIQTKYDTNFFDITLKKVDSDFSSNPTSKSLEIVDGKTYKYTITDLGNNSIHYYNLNISDINSFTTSNKKFHHITLRRDSTGPVVASFIIEGSPVGIGSQAPVHLQFDTPVQNFVPNDDITTQNGTIALSNPSDDKMTWIGYFTPTANTEDSTNILTLSDTYEDLAGNKGVTATTENYIVDTIAPTNQNTVFNSSIAVSSQATVSISSANETGGSVWFAPNGTTTFSVGDTMTTASGTATSITAPTTEGTYYLYIIDSVGNISNKSSNTLTVDSTAPTNQNTVFSSSITVASQATVSISSANETGGSVWFAPTGTTSFSASSTMTTASGTSTSITAPTNEGTYYLYIIDSVGNISNKSSNTLTVDNTAPSFSQGSYSFSISNNTSSSSVGSVSATDTHSITYSIVSYSSNIFAINSSNGAITLSTNCSDGNYTLSVRATDLVGNTSDVNISVKVDTTGPSFSTTSFSISTGVTAVGTVTATDPSPTSNPITYTNVGGTDTSKFSITSGGVLSLNSSGYSAGTYTVTIRATDALNNYSDQSISVTLATPFGTNWEKITDIGFSGTNPINTTHNMYSTKNYLTQSMNWASWSNSSIKEYVMVELEFYHTGSTGYQNLLTLGPDSNAVSPHWWVIFRYGSGSWFSTPANKIVITNNSMTAGQQSWVSYDHTSSNAGIAQGSYQAQKPSVGLRSQTNFSTYTTYKIKIVWEARLPATYTYSNSYDAYKARTSPGLDTTEMYLYVDSGSGYVLDTYTPNYAQSWSYGMGANYPPARGYGGETSKRGRVGLGPNAIQSYFNIGYYYHSSSYNLKSGTTVKPLQLCKIKKKSGGQYTVNSSTF